MKYYALVIGLLIMVFGLAAGQLMLPGEEELALMHFRAKEFDQARQAYETLWEKGERSLSMLVPLANLYLQYGDVDRAVEVMQELVTRYPGHQEARELLGTYFQYAQRVDDYILNLEELTRIEPMEEALRELSQFYNFQARYQDQIRVLRRLVTLYPDHPRDFMDLAYIQADQGQIRESLETLRLLERHHPEGLEPDMALLKWSLALDSSQTQEATQEARSWLSRSPDPEFGVHVIGVFRERGRFQEALSVLQPLKQKVNDHPRLLEQVIQLQLESGEPGLAFQRLLGIHSQRLLPLSLGQSLVELALARSRPEVAFEAADAYDLTHFPEWLLQNLLEVSLDSQRQELGERIVKSQGPELFQGRPVLGARWAMSQGDQAQTSRWLKRAEEDPRLEPHQKMVLAHLYQLMGKKSKSLALMSSLADLDQLNPAELESLAYLYLDLDKAAEGVQLFATLRGRTPAPRVDRSWALLAAASGREEEVLAWLRERHEERPGISYLRDLYFTAADRDQARLALEAALQLYYRQKDGQHRLLFVQALNRSRQGVKALKLARQLDLEGGEGEAAYLEALSQAWKAGQPVKEELAEYWGRKLAETGEEDPRRVTIVHSLLEVGAYRLAQPALRSLASREKEPWLQAYVDALRATNDKELLVGFLQEQLQRSDRTLACREDYLHVLLQEGLPEAALPYLRQFALALAGQWAFAYEDALARLGRDRELLEFLETWARREDLAVSDKRSIAYRLLEKKAMGKAKTLFLDLAAVAGPESPDVGQLLTLWAEEPGARAVDWLMARLRSAKEEDCPGWIRHLVDAGAAKQVVSTFPEPTPGLGQHPELMDSYMKALESVSEFQRLGVLLEAEIAVEGRGERLAALGQMAWSSGRKALAYQAFLKARAESPQQPQILKSLGQLAFQQGRYQVARNHLIESIELGQKDYEVQFLLGEILWREEDYEEAKRRYEEAIKHLGALNSSQAQLIRAQILRRQGDLEQSLRLLRRVVDENPHDQHLRADEVEILLDNKRYGEAQVALDTLLSTPSAEDKESSPEDPEATLRLHLLQARLMADTGDLKGAVQTLGQSLKENPENPSVLVALAELEQRSDRLLSATRLYQHALALEPLNQDISKAGEELFRERSPRAEVERHRLQIGRGWQADVLEISGWGPALGAFKTGLAYHRNDVEIRGLRDHLGGETDFTGQLSWSELLLQFDTEGGSRLLGSWFLNDGKGGMGLDYSRSDYKGQVQLGLEYGRPNWEYAEGLAMGLVQDRVSLGRQQRFGRRTSAQIRAALKRYRMGVYDPVATSFGMHASLQHELDRPRAFLEYALELEHRRSIVALKDLQGGVFYPLPLRSSEVHSFNMGSNARLSRSLHLDGYGGFAWDRLGGSGPHFGGVLGYKGDGPWEGRFFLDQTIHSVSTTERASRWGVFLLWRFK